MQLDDWVLCRLYNKKGTLEKHYHVDEIEMQQSWDRQECKPKTIHVESSSFDHVSSSPDKEEVQSEPPKWNEFDNYLDFQLQDNHLFSLQMQHNSDLFADMFGYM